MLIIRVKKGDKIDKYLKQFKKKFEKAGILRKVKKRMYFQKKSIKRRNEIIKAIYSNKKSLLAEE